MFDVTADPGETTTSPPRSRACRLLPRESLHVWMKTLARGAGGSGEETKLTREQCENLRALGYITADCPDERA